MKVCPACHRPFHTAKRTCASCGKPIKRNHRWHVDGCYIRHDDCSNPTMAPIREDAPLLPSLSEEENCHAN